MTSPAEVLIADGGTSLSAEPAHALRYEFQSEEPFEAAALLWKHLKPGARILDIGCGTGAVSELLVKASHGDFTGIEPSPERAAFARCRGLRVIDGTFPHPDVPANRDFDAIVFADVLEHLPDPAALLAQTREYLKPDGCILASLPNVAHWSVRWDLLRGRFDYEPCGIMDATHLRWFTKRSLTRLFESAGLKIESYAVSAGTDLPLYQRRLPWRWFGQRTRDRIIRRGVRYIPTLFGAQHVVKACWP